MTDNSDKPHGRPNHRVLAVLPSKLAAAAAADIAALGPDHREVQVLHGSSGIAVFDAPGHKHGLRAHIAGLLQDLGGVDGEGIASYREALEAGQYVLSIPMPAMGSIRPVVELLQRHGARDMRFFGTGTMETIPDDYPEPLGEADRGDVGA